MMERIKKKWFAGALVATLLVGLLAWPLSISAAEAIRLVGGTGTAEDPKIYLIDRDAKLTWKHFNDIREAGVTERYERRAGGSESGELLYAWIFEPAELNGTAEGPYFLGIDFYESAETASLPFGRGKFFFSFATKRNFPGRVKLRLRVGDAFAEGAGLYLYYYGGYDPTVLHGSGPVASSDEILRVDDGFEETASDIEVQGGYVEFYARRGGNYFLGEERTEYEAERAAAALHYAPETVMGSARALFRAAGLAEAVAPQTGKDADAALTQGDLDAIGDLYLSGLGLSDTMDLEAVCFSRLASLTLTDNKLTELGVLSMPELTRLDLSGNELSKINGVLKVEKLRDLMLGDNKLTAIPDLSALGALETLDLSGNALTAFPPMKSERLRYLDLSGNRLVKPPDLSGCVALEELNLLEQSFEAETETEAGEPYAPYPSPELLFELADGGEAVLRAGDEVVYETSLADFKASGGIVEAEFLRNAGAYALTLTGELGGETLGVYSYRLSVKGGIPYGAIVAGALALAAASVVALLLLRQRNKPSPGRLER